MKRVKGSNSLAMLSVTLALIGGGLYYGILRNRDMATEIALPLLTIAGVVVLLLSLALVSSVFAIFGLDDKNQALALPEGSIRAVIALSLVVLFAILSIFLYSNMSSDSFMTFQNVDGKQKEKVTATLGSQFAIIVTNAPTVTSTNTTNGNASLGTHETYTIYVRNNNQASADFAKQLLVMIGTLVTSVASFYFGSKAGASGQSTDTAKLAPVLRTIDPKDCELGVDPQLVKMTITGENLDLVREIRITSGDKSIMGTELTTNASLAKCSLSIDASQPIGPWDVVVTDFNGRQVKWAAGFAVKGKVAKA